MGELFESLPMRYSRLRRVRLERREGIRNSSYQIGRSLGRGYVSRTIPSASFAINGTSFSIAEDRTSSTHAAMLPTDELTEPEVNSALEWCFLSALASYVTHEHVVPIVNQPPRTIGNEV
jgi:hypothetical protein